MTNHWIQRTYVRYERAMKSFNVKGHECRHVLLRIHYEINEQSNAKTKDDIRDVPILSSVVQDLWPLCGPKSIDPSAKSIAA